MGGWDVKRASVAGRERRSGRGVAPLIPCKLVVILSDFIHRSYALVVAHAHEATLIVPMRIQAASCTFAGFSFNKMQGMVQTAVCRLAPACLRSTSSGAPFTPAQAAKILSIIASLP